MIIEVLYTLWALFTSWILGNMPTFDSGPIIVGVNATLAPVLVGAAQLGGWIPWGTVAICLPISVGLYVVTLLARAIKSFIPLISG